MSIIGEEGRQFVKCCVSYRDLGNILFKLIVKDITKANLCLKPVSATQKLCELGFRTERSLFLQPLKLK